MIVHNKILKSSIYIRFLLLQLFLSINLILPIRVLYMIQFNISYGEISILKAIFSLTVTFFELPTGVIADKISRKTSLLIATLFFSIHAIIYVLNPGFIGFIITQICLGLSSSFRSGADTAYLHEYITKETNDDYIDIQGKIGLYANYFFAIFALISSILFNINKNINFIVLFIMGGIACFTVLTLPPDKIKNDEMVSKKSILSDYFIQIKDSIRYLIENKYLMVITIYAAINFSFLIFNFEYYQIILNINNFPSKLNGILYSSFMILTGFGSRISKNIVNRFKIYSVFRLYMVLICFSYILIGNVGNLLIILLAIVIQQICYGSWGLILENIILEECPKENMKSTMASLNSFVTSIIKTVIVVVLGLVADSIGYRGVYIIMGICVVLLVCFSFSVGRKFSKTNVLDKV